MSNVGSVCVYLVGAGPGDPGLMSVRGLSLLERADVVVYDYLSSDKLLEHARPDAELVFVGKKGFEKHIGQDEINRILVEKARELERRAQDGGDANRAPRRAEGPSALRAPSVVRLKGGDPFVFGRGGEEALALAEAGIRFEVVPGMTSGIAAPAYAGVPVTHRGVSTSVTLVTGNEDPSKDASTVDWPSLAGLVKQGSTVCFYMGVRNLPLISEKLAACGAPSDVPVALVQWGTTTRQKTCIATLETAARKAREAGIEAPAIIVVGAVADLRERIAWFEDRPLFGRRLVVTRSREQAGSLSSLLREQGAEVFELPTISIVDPESFDPLDTALSQLGSYDWLIFTSVNGVERFFERLGGSELRFRDARALATCRVAAIGPATAAKLRAHGIVADVVPGEYRAEAVHRALRDAGFSSGQRVLIPRALEAREVLPQLLRADGGEVDVVPAYRTVAADSECLREFASLVEAGAIDGVTFASSSAVRNLTAALGDRAAALLGRVGLFSIGPITSDTVEKAGLEVTAEAAEFTIPGLVDALCEYFTSDRASDEGQRAGASPEGV
ncbi:MAG: uroporphyrinogen-III C-methyltransferase [Berryella intestinalis]|uniref:uroporphyrinogen-III C-methyltransferase n=1 Tax=Berryella intestinalis TaxID=1531429 RepID=UPI002A758AE7|nr:uroporphyrinogen-III C-methyltransferase [Berryella intestinalis]MDY3129339.1 uroporphyrinogen-III C-methyltransferase [Berryella intestinalis]